MPKYTIDTNLWIDAFVNEATAATLEAFLAYAGPITHLHAVVVQELRAGARTPKQVRSLDAAIFGPFERRRRVFGPSPAAFKECGRVLADMWRRDGVPFRERPRSLVNDILIAASCREQGVVLITRDRDFQVITPYVRGFTHVPPWPA